MHSEGILAGELKHGPLALIDVDMPVIMVVSKDHVYGKVQNALQQVVARHVSNRTSLQACTVMCTDDSSCRLFV